MEEEEDNNKKKKKKKKKEKQEKKKKKKKKEEKKKLKRQSVVKMKVRHLKAVHDAFRCHSCEWSSIVEQRYRQHV